MAKSLNIKVAKDHLERLTKANGTSALMELIWNSLDADSKNIHIKTTDGALGINQIVIEDDGHSLNYREAENVFETLGGSAKKVKRISPGGRKLHGEEGKGRLKSLSLGSLVKYDSSYKDNGSYKNFDILIDANKIQDAHLGDLKTAKSGEVKTGVKVTITNIDQENASIVSSPKICHQIEEKLAVYFLAYPDFNIYLNKKKLDFEKFITNKVEDTFKVKGKHTDFITDASGLNLVMKVKNPPGGKALIDIIDKVGLDARLATQMELVRDILNKKILYKSAYWKGLENFVSVNSGKKINLLNLFFSAQFNHDEYYKRPYSKLISDLIKK